MGDYSKAFKGSIVDLIHFFNSNYVGEDFDNAFQGIKRLEIKQSIISYDSIYILYRSIDRKYVLFERNFNENKRPLVEKS